MEAFAILAETVRLGFGGALVVAGLVLMLAAAIGQLRFPDFYTRLHAANAADSTGAILVVAGLAVAASDMATFVRLVLLAIVIGALAPTLLQFIANAAHAGGLAPLAGRYVAPRPGDRRAREDET